MSTVEHSKGETLKELRAGVFLTVKGRLPRGGSLQARRLLNGAVQFYWRYSKDSATSREPIGPYDSSSPPKKLEPTAKGYSIAAALARCEALAQTHSDHANAGGLRAAKDQERQQSAARKLDRAEAEIRSLGSLLSTYVAYLRAEGRRSYYDSELIFKLHVREPWPKIWETEAAAISPEQLLDILRRLIEQGKGRTSNKLRSYVRAAYQCAIDVRALASIPSSFRAFAITVNPAALIRRDARFDKADKRPLTAAELREYWRLTDTAGGLAGSALRVHLLCGAPRIEQLLRLKWKDVSDQEITLFDGKGRPGTGLRPHPLPLVNTAVKALTEIERIGEYVFSTTRGVKPISAATLSGWSQGLVGQKIADFQLKRVRSGVETLLASAGVGREVRGHLQSHGLGGVQARHYDGHDYMKEKRAALELLCHSISRGG